MSRSESPALIEDLLRPEAYPPPRPARVDLVTTHISWVFLTDHEVWKLKRPVDYGFLDYTTLDKRLHACREEVRLNRRLADGVYLDVCPVRLAAGGHSFAADGPIVDHAVRMRRLRDDASADAMLRRRALGPEHLSRLADRLARFYATAEETPAFGSAAAVRENVDENFEQVRPFVGRFLSAETFDAVRASQMDLLDRHADVLAARVAGGHVREGHGDLRLEHVYFEGDEPLVIDAIEFNERFRKGDVASDLAFLAMELDARREPRLAAWLLSRFAAAANDFDLYAVVDLYLSYRAWVRAKVACFLAADASTPAAKAARKADEARALFELARSCLGPRPAAPLLAVGGLIGTGKSTLAEALSLEAGVPVIGSDATRKSLARIAPTERAPEEVYSARFTERTFEEVFRRAAVVLRSGRGVILDATFRGRDLRARARALARQHARPFLFVETTCDDAVLRERLRRRAARPSVSDATEALLDRMRAEFEPVIELPSGEHVVVDTARPVADQVAVVLGVK